MDGKDEVQASAKAIACTREGLAELGVSFFKDIVVTA